VDRKGRSLCSRGAPSRGPGREVHGQADDRRKSAVAGSVQSPTPAENATSAPSRRPTAGRFRPAAAGGGDRRTRRSVASARHARAGEEIERRQRAPWASSTARRVRARRRARLRTPVAPDAFVRPRRQHVGRARKRWPAMSTSPARRCRRPARVGDEEEEHDRDEEEENHPEMFIRRGSMALAPVAPIASLVSGAGVGSVISRRNSRRACAAPRPCVDLDAQGMPGAVVPDAIG